MITAPVKTEIHPRVKSGMISLYLYSDRFLQFIGIISAKFIGEFFLFYYGLISNCSLKEYSEKLSAKNIFIEVLEFQHEII